MAKNSKAGSFDPAFVSELCVAVYTEELDKDSNYLDIGGVPVKERMITKYMAWKKCDRKTAEAYYVECANIERKGIERVLTVLTERGELYKEGTLKKKEIKKQGTFNKDYVYTLTVACFELMKPGRKRFVVEHMKTHGSTKERADQRFCDFAQNYAPGVRSILKALAIRGQLPKKAYA